MRACLYACIYSACLHFLWRPEKGAGFPGTVITDSWGQCVDLGTEPQFFARIATALNC